MSILDKMKKAHPAYWVLGLGGAALAIDYYVERNRSVGSSIYRKIFGGTAPSDEGEGGARAPYGMGTPMPGSALMPGSLYQTTQVYYPAFPPSHPYRHWMLREPEFGGWHRDWFGHHGFGHERFGHEGFGHGRGYGAFGRNHAR